LRELIKRLERLEKAEAPVGITRIVRVIVGATDGQRTPWNPTRAYSHADGAPAAIGRDTGEAVQTFEARAAAHFPCHYIIG
jgi:hypothetical protein